MLIISIPIAILPAYAVSSAFSRVSSLREYISTLVRPRGNLIWYLVALLTFPVLQILGLAITQLLMVLFAAFAFFCDRMWKKLPKDYPAVYPVGKAA